MAKEGEQLLLSVMQRAFVISQMCRNFSAGRDAFILMESTVQQDRRMQREWKQCFSLGRDESELSCGGSIGSAPET